MTTALGKSVEGVGSNVQAVSSCGSGACYNTGTGAMRFHIPLNSADNGTYGIDIDGAGPKGEAGTFSDSKTGPFTNFERAHDVSSIYSDRPISARERRADIVFYRSGPQRRERSERLYRDDPVFLSDQFSADFRHHDCPWIGKFSTGLYRDGQFHKPDYSIFGRPFHHHNGPVLSEAGLRFERNVFREFYQYDGIVDRDTHNFDGGCSRTDFDVAPWKRTDCAGRVAASSKINRLSHRPTAGGHATIHEGDSRSCPSFFWGGLADSSSRTFL